MQRQHTMELLAYRSKDVTQTQQCQHTMELLDYRSKDVTQTQQCQHTTELLAYRSKDVTQTQQQRPEWPTITLTWHASKYKICLLYTSDAADER